MRERLTEMIQNAVGGCARHWAEVIADNLLANGVIVPPCKVGDTVYVICNHEVQETTVFSMRAETADNHYDFFIKAKAVDGTNKTVGGYVSVFKTFLFGKNVFLTREEAEEALKKGGGE